MNDTLELGEMLSWRRPAGSKTERKFIKDHLLPLEMNIDKLGNLYKRIDDPKKQRSPVLWSCHTDTVHRMGGKQQLYLRDGLFTVKSKESNCLGADDTAGIWLMTQMIKSKVPGLYVFHRAEEVGGLGSEHIATVGKTLLEDIHFAIAFDRYGTNSIITHQGGLRCCSDDFSKSLSKELGMGHTEDKGGTFTDTANYTDLIPECTNLSVGYDWQHTKKEELDSKYLFELRDAMFDFNYKNLTQSRKPGVVEWDFDFDAYGVGNYQSIWTDEDQSIAEEIRNGMIKDYPASTHSDFEAMTQLVKDNPREIADFLEEYGVNVDEIREMIWRRGGVVRGWSEWRGRH
jgi:hypothetical protein